MQGRDRSDDGHDSEAGALEAEAAEIRRLVSSGAGSPEELRLLAERLRAHREREHALWERTVKPTLSRQGSDSDQTRRSLLIGFGLIGCVALVVLASLVGNAGLVVVSLAVAAVAVYAATRRRS